MNWKLERQKKNYGLWQVTGRKHEWRRKAMCKFTASYDPSGFCCGIVQSFCHLVLGYLLFLLISACLMLRFISYFEDPLLSVRTVNNITTCIYFPCVPWWTVNFKDWYLLGIWHHIIWWKCTDISEDCVTTESARMSVHCTRPHSVTYEKWLVWETYMSHVLGLLVYVGSLFGREI